MTVQAQHRQSLEINWAVAERIRGIT